MKKKKGEEAVKIKISREESATQEKEKPAEENREIKEKLPEKMSKADLLQKIKELQGKSEKDYDLYLRSQAEIDNIIKRSG